MSDDPINALVSELLAEADAPIENGTIVVPLEGGLSLVHNPCGQVMTEGAQRIRPGTTVVRLHGLPVGVVNPWRWTFTIDDDRVRYALMHALARLREGLPLATV